MTKTTGLARLAARAACVSAIAAAVPVSLAACDNPYSTTPPPQTAQSQPPGYGQPGYGQPGYAPNAYPPGYPTSQVPPGYPQAPPGYPQAQPPGPYAPSGQPQPAPGPYAPVPQSVPQPAPQPLPAQPSARPLLGPLLGAPAWQAEARAVARELVANLNGTYQARVASVPLVFDPSPTEVNAFASCDDSGAAFVAGTEGLLEAIDGISQTKASDELFGTQTYEAYVNIVAPRLVSKDGGSAALPAGIIPPQYLFDPRRISRAHEMFDEVVAFTFGHELAHHYLGHTGCANGQQGGGVGPSIAQLGALATSIVPGLNQPNEVAADTNGCINTLDTGRARAAQAYRWTEEGGLWLLDFFARMDKAAGANPFLGFLRTHPNPGLRIPIVQTTAATWRFQHPG